MAMDQHYIQTNIEMIRITENEYLGLYWAPLVGASCYGLIYVKKGGLGIEKEFQAGYEWAKSDYTDEQKKNMIVVRQMSIDTDASSNNK